VDAAIDAEPTLGDDQQAAVRALCGPGPALRVLLAPAGHGKTTALHAAATASHTAGRHVIALATTNKAVAELRSVGVDAHTIARFVLELDGGRVAPNTTVVVDEVSQVSTRDAARVLDALADVPGVQLWCLGDPLQTPSVRAGGLAAELALLTRSGRIPGSVLAVNRRQREPAERTALRRYRAGDVIGSQALRATHGWEHEHATADATRDALARAAVADADRYGKGHVVVLAVSHAECEDLADRIRAIRRDRKELAGPSMSGPGWGYRDREYCAGDRILLHAALRTEHGRLPNGTTATITVVTPDALVVHGESDDTYTRLPAWFVTGRRSDGEPNCSHAWARTIAGAQGATWEQVHLLGTAALDHASGYVGQSRSRQPTHTWNLAPEPAEHHSRHLADDRTATERVRDSLTRRPDRAFAARDDPWLLDRVLTAERAEHQRIIAIRPPFDRRALERADATLRRAESELEGAHAFCSGASQRLDDVSPIARLRRSGRDAYAHAEAELRHATQRLWAAERNHTIADAAYRACEREEAAREAWDRVHGWRLDRVTDIRHELRHHWANAVLVAARDGEPLAYGHGRLHDARVFIGEELRRAAHANRRRGSIAAAHREAELRDGLRMLGTDQLRGTSTAVTARGALDRTATDPIAHRDLNRDRHAEQEIGIEL
ncbi:MAG TPA: AAA family ATPase, partial [Micromonosporaceae bacterium]